MSKPRGTMLIGKVMTLGAVTLIIRRAPNDATAAKRLGKSREAMRKIKMILRDSGLDPTVSEDCQQDADHHCIMCGAVDNVVVPMGKRGKR